MSQRVILDIDDEIYAALQQQANNAGLSVSEWLVVSLNDRYRSPSPLESDREVRSGAIANLRGLLKTDRPTPTDEEVEAMLEQRRIEKYLS